MDINYQKRIAFRQFALCFPASKAPFPAGSTIFQQTCCFGNTVGRDVPMQVLSAIMNSHFIYWYGKARYSSGMLKSVVDEQCAPPELAAKKLLIPLVANRTGNLKFLNFSSSC